MSNQFEPLNPDGVVVFVDGVVLADHATALASDVLNGLKQANFKGSAAAKERLVGDGLPCKLLTPGGGWQTGKLRIRLEFCPDEPEPIEPSEFLEISNALDEFRQ